MRVLWNLLKFGIALAILIPVSIIVLATALGIFGALLGLAVLVLRIAIVGLVVWAAYKLARALFGRSHDRSETGEYGRLAPVDPYYEAAKRELDRKLGGG
jgi:hypothetical protein